MDWPSPSVGDVTGGRTVPVGTSATGATPHGTKVQIGLQTAVRESAWPTPSASMPNDTEAPESWLARAALLKEKHGNGNGAGMPLAVAVKLAPTWSTPTVNDAQNATAPPSQSERNSEALAVQSGATVAAALSPAWVCRLMGFPDDWTVISGPPAVAKRSTPASPRARRRASP